MSAAGPQRARRHAERRASRDGYFVPDSVIRRLGSTPVTPFLGGGTAVLLQVAHPLVAAGVAEHSDFRRDLWRRLARTLRALYLVAFGTREEADRAGAAVRAVHAHVRGVTREQLGVFPPGTPYAADDPELMLWVHATLVEASLSAYQRFHEPLSGEEQERYYREMAVVARIFAAPLPIVLQPLRPAHRLATAAQLPARLRAGYGLGWTPAHALTLRVLAQTVKITASPMLRAAACLRPPTAVTAH